MEKRRPLALVSLTPFFGGGEIYCERLALLLKDNFAVTAIVSNEELARRLQLAAADVRLLAAKERIARLREVRHQLRRFAARYAGATVLLNGQAEANLVSTAKNLGLRVVLVRHTDLRLQSGVLKRWLYRRNARRAEAVVCVSRTLAQQLGEFLTSDRIKMIPHWVSIVPGQKQPSAELRVLFVGRLEIRKGVMDLVQAARELPDVLFSLAGEGELRAQIERENLANVRLLGHVDDLPARYAEHDLLVQPSHSEGSSLAVLEAMAHGAPCLVSDIPVLQEIARNGTTAAVFACGEPAKLAAAIRDLRDHPEPRKALSNASLQMIATDHSPEKALSLYLSVL